MSSAFWMLCASDSENKARKLQERVDRLEYENNLLIQKCNALENEYHRLLKLNALHKTVILRNLDSSFIYDDLPESGDI